MRRRAVSDGTGTRPLATARLRADYDTVLLQRDLAQLARSTWAAERPFVASAPGAPVTPGWTALALRSPDGTSDRTDPGGPGLDDFGDTPVLAESPYLGEVLRSLPCELRGARLLALASHGAVPEHCDPHHGFELGQLRLHIPIQTNPDAVLILDGRPHCWEPGQLWYGDFSRPHALRNGGATPRVHLVIDCLTSRPLLDLFPASFLRRLQMDDVLFNRSPLPASRDLLDGSRCRFRLPATALRGARQGAGDGGTLLAQIDFLDGRLALFFDGRPLLGLVHLGGEDFRFSGWTEERTLSLRPAGNPVEAVFRIRRGRRARQLVCPATPLTPTDGGRWRPR